MEQIAEGATAAPHDDGAKASIHSLTTALRRTLSTRRFRRWVVRAETGPGFRGRSRARRTLATRIRCHPDLSVILTGLREGARASDHPRRARPSHVWWAAPFLERLAHVPPHERALAAETAPEIVARAVFSSVPDSLRARFLLCLAEARHRQTFDATLLWARLWYALYKLQSRGGAHLRLPGKALMALASQELGPSTGNDAPHAECGREAEWALAFLLRAFPLAADLPSAFLESLHYRYRNHSLVWQLALVPSAPVALVRDTVGGAPLPAVEDDRAALVATLVERQDREALGALLERSDFHPPSGALLAHILNPLPGEAYWGVVSSLISLRGNELEGIVEHLPLERAPKPLLVRLLSQPSRVVREHALFALAAGPVEGATA